MLNVLASLHTLLSIPLLLPSGHISFRRILHPLYIVLVQEFPMTLPKLLSSGTQFVHSIELLISWLVLSSSVKYFRKY